MKRKNIVILLLAVIVLGSPLYALSIASSRALDAFRRYEPDFANSLRRLEELDRRVDNLKIDEKSSRFAEIKDEAEESMDRIQKRYDLMEDLFTNVSGSYPADRPQLFDGFSRIDDLYRANRDFYLLNFVNRASRKKTSAATAPESAGETAAMVDSGAASDGDVSDSDGSDTGVSAVAPEKGNKLDVSGVMKLDFRNRNEVYRTQSSAAPFVTNETALPNNLSQARLSLSYKFDEKRQLHIDDRFLIRERNEPVHENYLTLAYLNKINQKRAWTLKNTLQHAWYPDNSIKNYRNNLAEFFYNERWEQRERLANLGYQSRVYPQYSRSDFHQFNLGDQETWFRNDGNFFAEFKADWRKYRNVNYLDYNNFNLYSEFNRSYAGNKSELSLSNTFDRRNYDDEAANLYRTSYYDNYFRAGYDLPMHSKLSYSFEGQYQKRNYSADEPRGYSELNMLAAAKFRIDSDTRAQADYRYVYNDENTRIRAHKNHKFHGMWQKNYSKSFKVRLDDTLHLRNTVVGDIMDFKENSFAAKLAWRLNNGVNLGWNSEYLTRSYDALFYRDYKFLHSGLEFSYAKSGEYDWTVDQSWRRFSFRNGNNVSTGWEDEAQPITELKYNYVLQADLKLRLRASWEKSYYRSFDSISQELLWDFARPMTITEFYGGLEYTF